MTTRLYQTTDTHIDTNTGEIKAIISHSVRKIENEDSFVKKYVSRLSTIKGVPLSGRDVLDCFLGIMNYDGIVDLSTATKQEICEHLSITGVGFANNITKLIKADLITRVGKGRYLVNPHYFAKGCWSDVRKQRIDYIELSMKFTSKGEEISVNTVMKEESEDEIS